MGTKNILPLIPTREIVFFPQSVIPIIIGRDFSKRAIEYALEHTSGEIVLSIQKNSNNEYISGLNDIEEIAVTGRILQLFKLQDGAIRVIIEGNKRVTLNSLKKENEIFFAKFENRPIKRNKGKSVENLKMYVEETVRELDFIKNNNVPEEIIKNIFSISSLDELIYTLAINLDLAEQERVKLLKAESLVELFDIFAEAIKIRLNLEKIDKNVDKRVRNSIEDNQRQYIIKEKIKGLYSELGEDNPGEELDNLEKAIKEKEMPEELKTKLFKDLSRLKRMNEASSDASVLRTYIDNVLEIPWAKNESPDIDIKKAEKVLNDEHYGLKEVKDTILEYLSVIQLTKNNPKKMASILCLIGPPGVGKTSFAISIAHAMNRKFDKIALGGVHDESEIRGHRKTYVGAMPGKVIQSLKKVGVNNPVILFDEIDKLGYSNHGDPAAALLEVLDPAQNKTFKDNYVEFEYDLSDAFFICTANDYSNIPKALLDRMEVIELDSYTVQEKLSIAKNYLVKQVKEETSISDVKLSDNVILDIINKYTSEAGVRNLRRAILKIFRKIAKIKLENPEAKYSITSKNLEDYLGVEKIKADKLAKKETKLGVVKGLAWTAVGGTTLDVEAVTMKGKGNILLTGKLGEVMQESAKVAHSYVRANWENLDISDENFYENKDIHLHFPEGATPKDGPSAGITITTAIVSILSNKKVRQDVAMTGEITIKGDVLAIGGVKEKVIAANRIGIKEVILPFDNKSDSKNIPKEVLEQTKIHFVKEYKEVANIVFER